MYKTEVYRLHINMCILARPGLDYTEQGIPTLASPPLICPLSLSLSPSLPTLSPTNPLSNPPLAYTGAQTAYHT